MPPASRKRVYAAMAAVSTVLVVLGTMGVLSLVGPGSSTLGRAAAAEAPTPQGSALGSPTASASAPQAARVEGSLSDIKNVVLLLADDLDWDLFNEVPRLEALKDEGTTLTNFVVTDSLCCPSRTSILRSQYVHNHHVVSNIPATGGGWQTFDALGLEESCLPTWLQSSGVQTALVGKYLNGFPKGTTKRTYIPPGWDHFVTSISGNQSYKGYDYTLNENGSLKRYRSGPHAFMNDVLTQNATSWLSTVTEPFFLEFASYSPHTPAPSAERNVGTHAGATAPRSASFNVFGANEPAWLAAIPAIAESGMPRLDRLWTRRAESAESIADSYDALVSQLAASGHLDDTLIIVTSDNGYHVGEHRLPTGKQTPYHEDTVVPAVLIGPGIAKGATIDKMASTIDLGPTIAAIQGATVPAWVDGRNLLPLLASPQTAAWRTGVLAESLAAALPGDPDYTGISTPQFHALRTEQWLYVDYGTEQALYDLVNDPDEIDNVLPTTPASVVDPLKAQLAALQSCRAASCRVADSMPVPTSSGSAKPTTAPSPTASPTPSASLGG